MEFIRQRGFAFALLAGGMFVMSVSMALPTELDEESCRLLREEQERLASAGVRDSMANGPEWAKTNLPAAKLKEIQRLIEVDEQVLFRCPQPKPVEVSNGKDEGKEEEASAKEAPKVPVPKRKPKPKANDAYVPPSKVNDAYVPPPKPKAEAEGGSVTSGQRGR